MLSSNPMRDVQSPPIRSSTAALNMAAPSAYSTGEKPPMLSMTGHGRSANLGNSVAMNASKPGLGRPIEFNIPPDVSTIRGGSLPCLGDRVTVLGTYAATGGFLTTVPPRVPNASPVSSRSSVPEALMRGWESSSGPRLTFRSTGPSVLTYFLSPRLPSPWIPTTRRTRALPGKLVRLDRPSGVSPWRSAEHNPGKSRSRKPWRLPDCTKWTLQRHSAPTSRLSHTWQSAHRRTLSLQIPASLPAHLSPVPDSHVPPSLSSPPFLHPLRCCGPHPSEAQSTSQTAPALHRRTPREEVSHWAPLHCQAPRLRPSGRQDSPTTGQRAQLPFHPPQPQGVRPAAQESADPAVPRPRPPLPPSSPPVLPSRVPQEQ